MKVDDGVFNPAGCGPTVGRSLTMTGIYSLFARVLDYPGAEVSAQVQELIAQVAASNSEAIEPLRKFESGLKSMNLGELQELYTSTFDMRPDRTTNLGCHIFGEDVRRNIFMAQLKDRMEARRIRTGTELPDHLSLVLQLLAAQDSTGDAQTLIEDCLIPGVTRMLASFDQNGNSNPYADALQALLTELREEMDAVARARPAPE